MDWLASRIPSLPNTAVFSAVFRDPKALFAVLALVILVLYGISVGRTRALVSLLSIYFAYMLAVLFPFLPWVTEKMPLQYRSLASVALFIVLYGITFTILTKSMLKGRITLGEISFWQVVVISLVQIGLLTSICLSLLPVQNGQQLIGPLYRWFGGQQALWAWAVASLLMMPFMRAHRRE